MRVPAVCAIAVVLLFATTACVEGVSGTPAVGANAAATATSGHFRPRSPVVSVGGAGRIGFQRNTGVDLPGLGRPSWHPDSRVLEVRRQPGWGWCVLLPALSASAVDA